MLFYNQITAVHVTVVAGNDDAVLVEAQSLGLSGYSVQFGLELFLPVATLKSKQ